MEPVVPMPSRRRFGRQLTLLMYLAILSDASATYLQRLQPTESSVRLTDGAQSLEGRLELRVGNEWVSTCGGGLGVSEARTVCRLLGLAADDASPSKVYAPGRILINAVLSLRCPADASSLQQCVIRTTGPQTGCSSPSAAWVRCGATLTPGAAGRQGDAKGKPNRDDGDELALPLERRGGKILSPLPPAAVHGRRQRLLLQSAAAAAATSTTTEVVAGSLSPPPPPMKLPGSISTLLTVRQQPVPAAAQLQQGKPALVPPVPQPVPGLLPTQFAPPYPPPAASSVIPLLGQLQLQSSQSIARVQPPAPRSPRPPPLPPSPPRRPPLPPRRPLSPPRPPPSPPRRPPSPPRSPPPSQTFIKPPLSSSSSPPPNSPQPLTDLTTCRVVLVGKASADLLSPRILQADVQCTGSGTGGTTATQPVNVTVGGRLLAFRTTWRGVLVSQRPGDEEWGLTFNNVPYMRVQDSVVRDLPYSRGALLQCANCTKFDLFNVTVAGLWQPPGATGNLHGPVHASNVSYVNLNGFNCSDVREANGWACVMLQYNTQNVTTTTTTMINTNPPTLSLVNCTFRNNSVVRRGMYGTVHTFKTAQSTAATVGLGLVVVGPQDRPEDYVNGTAAGSNTKKPSTPSSLAVTLSGVAAIDNYGGFGTLLSVTKLTMESLSISRCLLRGNTAVASGGVIAIGGPIRAVQVTDGSNFEGNRVINVDGGGIFLLNGTDVLAIEVNSSFRGNKAEKGDGGAIRSLSRILSLSVSGGSRFEENFADIDGGAIALNGLGTLTLTGNSSMSGNIARRGGAIWVSSTGGDGSTPGNVTLDSSSVLMWNVADDTGGAIAADGGLGEINILRGSAMSHNYAVYGGGAVSVLSGDVDSIVLAGGSRIYGCSTRYNDGGAVLVAAGALARLEITDASAVRGNWAANGTGGAVAVAAGMGHLLIDGESVMSDNHADNGAGGAVAVYGTLNALEIASNSTVYNNSATTDGGGVWASGGVALMKMSDAAGAAENRAGGSGGLLHAGDTGGDAAIMNILIDGGSWLLNNTAGLHGGVAAVAAPYGSVRLAGSSNLSRNVAERGNGGVLFWSPKPLKGIRARGSLVMTVIDVLITGNRAGGGGGALFLAPNTALDSAIGVPPPMDSGRVEEVGADIWFIGIANATLQRNSAAGGAGGAILAAAGPTSELHLSFVNCTMGGNQAGGAAAAAAAGPSLPVGLQSMAGGAVAVAGLANDINRWSPLDVAPALTTTMVQSPPAGVSSNSSNVNGGYLGDALTPFKLLPLNRVLVGGKCQISVTDSAISDNIAAASGGGLFLTICTALIDRSWFSRNIAGRSGGAVSAEAPSQVPSTTPAEDINDRWWYALLARNSTFMNNTALAVGGGAVATVTSGLVAFHGCDIRDNNARGTAASGGSGGGVAARPPTSEAAARSGSALEIVSTSFASNSAGAYGGGIFTGALSAINIASSTLTGNTAVKSGGGVAVVAVSDTAQNGTTFVTTDSSKLVRLAVINSRVGRNSAPLGDGGGLYVSALLEGTVTRVMYDNNVAGGRGSAVAVMSPYDLNGFNIRSTLVSEGCGTMNPLYFFYDPAAVDCALPSSS